MSPGVRQVFTRKLIPAAAALLAAAVAGEPAYADDALVNLQDFNKLVGNFGLSAAGPDATPQDWAVLAAALGSGTAPQAMLIKYTHEGDATLDGVVNLANHFRE